MYRVMVRSFEGWRFYGTYWERREVWSTFEDYDTETEALVAKILLLSGGVSAVICEGETEYNRFCYSHLIA